MQPSHNITFYDELSFVAKQLDSLERLYGMVILTLIGLIKVVNKN